MQVDPDVPQSAADGIPTYYFNFLLSDNVRRQTPHNKLTRSGSGPKSQQLEMHDTAFMDHVNVVKLLDINKDNFAYDMANLMNKVDPDMAKVRMFRCDVMGGWHCDTFYEGPSFPPEKVTARGAFHSVGSNQRETRTARQHPHRRDDTTVK